jgi:hypothetical protein
MDPETDLAATPPKAHANQASGECTIIVETLKLS